MTDVRATVITLGITSIDHEVTVGMTDRKMAAMLRRIADDIETGVKRPARPVILYTWRWQTETFRDALEQDAP